MGVSVWVDPKYITSSRFVAEYYASEYLALEEQVEIAAERLDHKALGNLGKLFAGPFGSTLPTSVYVEEGVPLLRVQNVGELEILTDNLVNIGLDTHQEIIRSRLVSGDLAIAKAGRIGTTAVIPTSIPECNVTQHVIGVQVDKKKVDNHYLATFLISKYGRFQFERQGVGTLLKYLGVEDTREVRVLLPPRPVQTYIGDKVRLAERCRSRARELKNKAEKYLEDLLELPPLPQIEGIPNSWWVEAINFDTIRLEPAYYLPVYLDAIRRLEEIGALKLGEGLLRNGKYGASVPADYKPEGIPFIRGTDLSANRIALSDLQCLNIELAPKVRTARVKEGDVLITRSGTVGVAATVLKKHSGYAYGSFMIRLEFSKEINPFYAAAFLNSPYGRLQTERQSNGAVQLNINLQEIDRILMPAPYLDRQQTVAALWQEYNTILDTSFALIREAKADVEAFIEGRLDVEGIIAGRVVAPTWAGIAAQDAP